MKQEYVIADGTIQYMSPVNPLNRLVYTGTDWTRDLDKARKYVEPLSAIEDAKILNKEGVVKVFVIQTDPNRQGIGVGEVKF